MVPGSKICMYNWALLLMSIEAIPSLPRDQWLHWTAQNIPFSSSWYRLRWWPAVYSCCMSTVRSPSTRDITTVNDRRLFGNAIELWTMWFWRKQLAAMQEHVPLQWYTDRPRPGVFVYDRLCTYDSFQPEGLKIIDALVRTWQLVLLHAKALLVTK